MIEAAWSRPIDLLLLPLHAYIGSIGEFWHALNAPGLFVVAIAIRFAPLELPGNFARLPIERISFLVGGLTLWIVIGNLLDIKRGATQPKPATKALRVMQMLTIMWGLYLGWQGLDAVSAKDSLARHPPGSVLNGGLVVLWSILLITVPVASLAGAIRSRPQRADQAADPAQH